MFFFLSSTGRGGFVTIGMTLFLGGGLGLGIAIGGAAAGYGFVVGWFALAAMCWFLDRGKLGGDAPDKFCGLQLKVWTFIFGGIGLFVLPLIILMHATGTSFD